AASGLALSELLGSEVWDGIGSLGIGAVLTFVAFLLGLQSRNLLLGAAAGKDTIAGINETLASFPDVTRAVRVLTMQMGPHDVLVSGDLEVRANLSLEEAEILLERIDAELERRVPEIGDTFWEIKRASAGA